MKKLLLLLTLFAGTAWASECSAQGRLSNQSKLGLSYVLGVGGVSEELRMTDGQVDDLRDLNIDVREKLSAEIRNFRLNFKKPGLSPKDLDLLEAQLELAILEIRDQELEAIRQVLTEAQIDRIRQIRMQLLTRSLAGFSLLEQQLDLSSEQVEAMRKVSKSLKRKTQKLDQESKVVPASERQRRITEFRRQAEAELEQILSASQQATMRKLKGERFNFENAAKPKEKRRPEMTRNQEKSAGK